MHRTLLAALILALPLAGQAVFAQEEAATTRPATRGAEAVEGAVTGVSDNFGNIYTDIKSDRYEELGLKAGGKIAVTFGDKSVTLTLGERYDDVKDGEPVAVLHREGLTFAIRNGSFAETHGLKRGDTFTVSVVQE